MINISKFLMMSFAFLILTGLSYAGSEDMPSDIKSPVTNEDKDKDKSKENEVASNKEKDKQPKEKQRDSSSQATKKR